MVQEELNQLAYAWLILAVSYLAVTFALGTYLNSLRVFPLKLARSLLTVTVMIHWSLLVYFWTRVDPTEPSMLLASSFFAALAVLSCLILLWRRKALPVILFALPFTGVGMILAAFIYDANQVIRLPSIWLWSHIVMMVIGELFFFFSACVGITYLVAERKLKTRGDFSFFSGALNSLPAIDQWIHRLLVSGLFFLSGGLLIGFFFAREFWQGSWWLDPKVVFALLVWLSYAGLLLLRRASRRWLGRRSARAVLVAFVLAVTISLIVDQFSDTQHAQTEISEEPAWL